MTFHHNVIIFTKNDEFFCIQSKNLYNIDDEILINDILHNEPNINKLIFINYIWPFFYQCFTIAPDPLPINFYIKSPYLLYYNKDNVLKLSLNGYLFEKT